MVESIEVLKVSPEVVVPDTVSVLHWNVWHRSEPGEIVELLSAADPDIVCLHELASDSSYFHGENVAERVRDELGVDGAYQEVHHLQAKIGNKFVKDGAAILSKKPVVSSSSTTLSEGGWDVKYQSDGYRRMYVEAAIDVEGEILTVGTAHLSLLQAVLGNWGVRNAETAALREIVQQKQDRFVLTGDFNTARYGQSVRAMSELLQRADGVLATPTFARGINILGKSVSVKKRLDYIFVTPDIEVAGGDVLDKGPSDHNPLYVVLGRASLKHKL